MAAETNTLLDRSIRFATIALAAMPVLGIRPLALTIALWFALLVVRLLLTPKLTVVDRRTCLVLCAPFLLMLVDLLRSTGDHDAWVLVERSAALAIFPIAFLLLGAPSDKRIRDRSMDVFSIASLLLAVVVNCNILLLTTDRADSFAVVYRARFGEFSGVHPPYAAYWFFAAALFQVHRALAVRRSMEEHRFIALRVVIIAGCTTAGALIGSRMPVAAFMAAMVVLLFAHLRRSMAIGSTVLMGVCFVATLVLLPGLRERVQELGAGSMIMPRANELTSVNIRTPITQCTFQLLEENWLLGVGQQHTQFALDACYESLDLPLMIDQGYGPHDQPLHWWLAFGVAGFAAFALLFGWSFRHAWQRSDMIHLAFLLFLLLCCFTEDLLTRQWGVVLFAFFNTLFIASHKEPHRER